MKSLRLAAAAALLIGAVASVSGAQAKEIIIKFSHVTAETGHPKGEAAKLFAERVNEQMKGRVQVQVFPSSQLYNDDKVLEAMLLGDVQMAAPSLSKFEKFTKKYRIFDLPFMFDDINAVDAFQASEHGQALLGAMEKKGLMGLTFWHNGMKQMSANKPLLDPSDAAGLKFRIQTSDVLEAQFRTLEANPQKMAFAEVYGALQTGVVDGQENTWSNIFTKKFFEVQDGITETNHGVIDYLVVVSDDWWNGLPGDIRDELGTILAAVTAERNAISASINQDNKQMVLDSGGVVRQLTAEQKQAWRTALRPVWDQFADDIGDEMIDAATGFNAGS